MSKLDEAKRCIREWPDASNTLIADAIGCDEGLVRKARPLVELDTLRAQVANLRAELAKFRRATLARPRKPKNAAPKPLLERIEDDRVIQIVHFIGDDL